MAHQWWSNDPSTGAGACPAPMTRADLLALRTAGTLSTDCHYVITDHVQNRLIAGTSILLHAVAVNELSHAVTVNTPYHNSGWQGRYDIDDGFVHELRDNLGNVVIGSTPVANFDWGNVAYTGCRLENATWTVTYGNPTLMTRVRVIDNATLITTATTGSLTDTIVMRGASVDFNATQVVAQTLTVDDATLVCNNSFTVAFTRATVSEGSTITTAGTLAFFGLVQSVVRGQSSITHASNLGTVNIQRTEISNTSAINHTATALGMTIISTRLDTCSITHTTGSLNFDVGCLLSRATITKAGAGSLTLQSCSVIDNGTINWQGAGNCTMASSEINGGQITSAAGSTSILTTSALSVSSGAFIQLLAASTNTITFVQDRLDTGAFVQKGHTGVASFTQNHLSGNSRIIMAGGARNYTVQRNRLIDLSAWNLIATAVGTDTFTDNFTASGSSISTTSSAVGAPNSVRNSTISNSGQIIITGTQVGLIANRLTVDGSTITFSNNVALASVLDLSAKGQSIITVSGLTAVKDIRSLVAESNSTITIGGTVAGTVFRVSARQGSVVTVALTNTQVFAVECNTGGQLLINGGTLNFCRKSMNSQLTTGAFVHSNIIHETQTNKILTVANANRADYMGLLPQLL